MLSNNQCNATLWVLDTCHTGLLPLMIILMTALLSSKMYNCASHWEELAFVATWSRFEKLINILVTFLCQLAIKHVQAVPDAPWVDDSMLFDECNTSITTSHRSRAGSPSIRKTASNEKNPKSVELWDTDVCFLHIPLMGPIFWLPKIHKIHLEVEFESSRSPAKSESWNKPNRQCWAVFHTWPYCW